MKDHEMAQLVSALTSTAREFHDHQSLRQRISELVVSSVQRSYSVNPRIVCTTSLITYHSQHSPSTKQSLFLVEATAYYRGALWREIDPKIPARPRYPGLTKKDLGNLIPLGSFEWRIEDGSC